MSLNETIIQLIKFNKKFVLKGEYSDICSYLTNQILPKIKFNSIYLEKDEDLTKFYGSHYDVAIMSKENPLTNDELDQVVFLHLKRNKVQFS